MPAVTVSDITTLERIPEPKEKYDPWGVARPAEPAKKPK